MLLDSNLLKVELLTIPNDDKFFLFNHLVLLEVLFEIKIEFGFDFLHCVKRILDSHDLLWLMAALFVLGMVIMELTLT